jgi:hypothetical protein
VRSLVAGVKVNNCAFSLVDGPLTANVMFRTHTTFFKNTNEEKKR